MILISGCGTKTPFKQKDPLDGAAVVYVYATDNVYSDEGWQNSRFKLRINGKNVRGELNEGEFQVFDMKPATVLITAVRQNAFMLHVKLKLEAGKIYFLRLDGGAGDSDFTFEDVTNTIGSKEIVNSKKAGSLQIDFNNYVPDFADSTVTDKKDGVTAVPAMSEAEIDAIIEKKLNAKMATMPKPAPTPAPLQPKAKPSISRVEQMDQLDRAFGMKEKGILTDAEYQKMKAEILGK
jgi:hypothetical protein